jgi:hypothetical protein
VDSPIALTGVRSHEEMILLLFFCSHLDGPVGRIGAAVKAASNDVAPLGHLVTVQ